MRSGFSPPRYPVSVRVLSPIVTLKKLGIILCVPGCLSGWLSPSVHSVIPLGHTIEEFHRKVRLTGRLSDRAVEFLPYHPIVSRSSPLNTQQNGFQYVCVARYRLKGSTVMDIVSGESGQSASCGISVTTAARCSEVQLSSPTLVTNSRQVQLTPSLPQS